MLLSSPEPYAFLIMSCPLFVYSSIFSHFQLHLWNHLVNFKPTKDKAFLGKSESKLPIERVTLHSFSKERKLIKCENGVGVLKKLSP